MFSVAGVAKAYVKIGDLGVFGCTNQLKLP